MIVSEKVDWLSATFPHGTKLTNIIPKYLNAKIDRIKSPIPVYDVAYEVSPTRQKILIGTERLGVHTIMSAKTLDIMEFNEVSLQEIWNMIVAYGGKVSRIDLACDVQDCPDFTPEEVRRRFYDGECDTRLVGSKYIGAENGTETMYIGKMNSRKRKLRVYDKAVQQELVDKYWTRIEYEKRSNAHNTAMAVFDRNQTPRQIISSAATFPRWQLWLDVFSCEPVTIPRIEKPESDWIKKLNWLLTTYPKAIVNTMIDEYNDKLKDFEADNSDVLNTFLASLSAEIRIAQNSGKLPLSREKDNSERG